MTPTELRDALLPIVEKIEATHEAQIRQMTTALIAAIQSIDLQIAVDAKEIKHLLEALLTKG